MFRRSNVPLPDGARHRGRSICAVLPQSKSLSDLVSGTGRTNVQLEELLQANVLSRANVVALRGEWRERENENESGILAGGECP